MGSGECGSRSAGRFCAVVDGLEEQSFYRDELRQAAVLHHLTVIGEAVRLSADLKDEHLEMPWHRIVSVRNRIVHAYFDREGRILWVTAASNVPDLLAKVEAIVRAEFPGSGRTR